MKGPALQFPVAFGAITVSYNLSGVKSGLKLDGPTLANIFIGKIKTWNDPAIKSAEPGHEPARARRSRSCTARTPRARRTGFTTFLSDVSPQLEVLGRRRQGRQVADRHRRGQELGRRGGGQADPGRRRLRRAGVRAGERVHLRGGQELVRQVHRCRRSPNTSAAADGIKVPADLGISTINSPRPTAYPIVSQTFLVTYKDPCKDGGQ